MSGNGYLPLADRVSENQVAPSLANLDETSLLKGPNYFA